MISKHWEGSQAFFLPRTIFFPSPPIGSACCDIISSYAFREPYIYMATHTKNKAHTHTHTHTQTHAMAYERPKMETKKKNISEIENL